MQGLPIQNTVTMSSREIAELAGKQHKHVLRDIRTMLIRIYGMEHVDRNVPEKYRNRHSEYIRQNGDKILDAISRGFGDGPNWGHQENLGVTWKRDKRGYIEIFYLDYSHTITLITGYDVEKRKKVVDRWLELEAQAAQPYKVPQTYAAALLEAGRLALENERLTAECEALLPRAEAHDRLSAADGSLSVTEAAKALKVKPKTLFAWLSRNRWIYRRTGSARWLGYQAHTSNGDLEHRTTTIICGDGSEKITEQVRVTAKGLTKLAKVAREIK